MTVQSTVARGGDFRELSKRIQESGLMRPRHVYYLLRFGIVLGLFAASWVLFVALGESWWQLVVAAVMGILFTQVAFLGHDVGHRQVFKSLRAARITGWLIGNLGIGLGYGWWIDKHSRHHANPNHVDEDPDVGSGVILWSDGQVPQHSRPIARWLGGRQAYWFFPVLLFEGLSLHVDGFRSLRDPAVKHKPVEAALLTVHVVVYLSAVFLVLPVGMAVAFVAVHLGVFGFYMGCSFAPNHKGMPLLDEKMDYLRKQVLTTRNVRGGVLVDVLLGGLDYQIEHHLFPTMPMVNLPKAQPIVQAYCRQLDIPYYEVGLLRSYGQILAYLHDVAAPLRGAHATTDR